MRRVGDVVVKSLKWRTQYKTDRRVLPLVYDVVCIAMGCIVNGKGVVKVERMGLAIGMLLRVPG
jgi:4-hydroxy-3-methylbut-2-en-1-yl diphosphate synthase IspG/GcpE